jgi:hypothetical protein
LLRVTGASESERWQPWGWGPMGSRGWGPASK